MCIASQQQEQTRDIDIDIVCILWQRWYVGSTRTRFFNNLINLVLLSKCEISLNFIFHEPFHLSILKFSTCFNNGHWLLPIISYYLLRYRIVTDYVFC